MKVYGNQKVILVKKAPTDKNNLYSTINIEAAHAAMRNLQDAKAGFMLWYYIAENQNNYMFALSSADFMNKTGCKIKAYNAAVDALIEKGYLVKQDKLYIFYENGLMPSEDIEDQNYTGTSKSDTYPLRSQVTCALTGHYLSSQSTRNITNNTNNNTINIISNKNDDDTIIPDEDKNDDVMIISVEEARELVELGDCEFNEEKNELIMLDTGEILHVSQNIH